MRLQGRIAEWNDDRGFGFITPLNGGIRVFVHVSEFPRDLRRPETLDLVTYELSQGEHGRPRAAEAQFLAPTPGRSSRKLVADESLKRHEVVLVVTLVVVLLASGLVIHGDVLVLVLGYLILSSVTYLAYGMDKSAAQRGAFRTEESALHLLALAGGWPGALLAQKHFHHKTRKQSFQSTFWVTVVFNVVTLVVVVAVVASSR